MIVRKPILKWQWYWFGEFTIKDHSWRLDVELPKDKAYSGHWWVDPQYRYRRNFFHNFFRNQWSDLKNRGIKKDVCYIDGWNRKALSSGIKLGYVGSSWIERE